MTAAETASRMRANNDRAASAMYGIALLGSILTWLVTLRTPLWLDETFSYWQIHAGFRQILSRRGGLSAAYPYILWLATRLTGTSEMGLRVPSIFAMLAAVYLLFLAAREMFGREVAWVGAIVFCTHPLVIFAAIDARPYAFGALCINAAIFLLVKVRRSNSNLTAALFGIATGAIAYFHLVFCVILPVLAFCFVLAKRNDPRTLARQFCIAFASFALMFLPNLPDLLAVFHARQALVFDKDTPRLMELAWTLAPAQLSLIFLGALFLAAATRKLNVHAPVDAWILVTCASLALVPLFVLYVVSVNSTTNVFIERYRMVALPGIAIAWCWGLSRIDSRAIRLIFCVVLVGTTIYGYLRSPNSRRHGYTLKYALELAEANASADNATVILCSDFPNSDYVSMPTGAAVKDSGLFAPLSYYKLSVPVAGLPRTLNAEAMRVGSEIVERAASRGDRFLVIAAMPSYPTARWLTGIAPESYEVRTLADGAGIVVLEFLPRN